MTRAVDRLIDANGNRAAEGLRVLEDVARFLLDDALLGELAKTHRHAVRAAIPPTAIAARDTAGDVGTTITASDEMRRARLVDLVRANAARVQEALRTCEEALKLTGQSAAAAALEAARYAVYRLETGLLARLPAWRLYQVRLYALVDTSLTDDPVRVAGAVARGGAGAVQLRAKGLDQRAYHDLAQRVQEATRAGGALFVVNDHVAVARAIGADGVHVGQGDLAIADTRMVVGPGCAVGLSTHTPEQVVAGLEAGADYLGLGPMFATNTKPHEPERGPALLDAVRERLRSPQGRPSYAIGGLDRDRITALRSRLPHGVAVAAALCRAPDPERAAAELLLVLDPDEFA
ncbi:MAG: thiamine phosphate synthase [Planctomycetes bacterium]|jgi:thiamine-phosphate pyrophosphorylase|nr:thiamine phosphate synthase [Planctomycetota bacterium]